MISTLERVSVCGRRVSSGKGVTLVRSAEGVARYTGVQTCGSIWACPVCSAKIRQVRADELHAGLVAHARNGGGAYFVTLTIRHHKRQRLDRTLSVVQGAFRRLLQGRNRTLDVGPGEDQLVGVVRATEITHGGNGWHPHVHALVLTREPLPADVAAALDASVWRGWERAVLREGGADCAPMRTGYRFEAACDPVALAAYVSKVRDAEQVVTSADRARGGREFGAVRSLSLEMARSDLKAGRGGSRHPFQIAADAASLLRISGEMATDLDLWREYERATRGRRAMSWSRGLRPYFARLTDQVAHADLSDEVIARESLVQDDDEVIARLDADVWRELLARPGMRAQLLDLAETGGAAAVALQLNALRFFARSG